MKQITIARDDDLLEDFGDDLEDDRTEENEWDRFEEEERQSAVRDFLRSPHK